MNEQNDLQKNDEIEIDLMELWGILKRKVGFIAMVSVLFVAAGVGYCFLKAPEYQSVSIISVDAKQLNFFRSRDVLEPVMKKYAKKDEAGNLPNFEAFKQQIKFIQAKGSNDTTVTVTAGSPEEAQKINQAVLDGGREFYIQFSLKRLDTSMKYAEEALARMNDEVARVESDLQQGSSSRTDSVSYDIRVAKLNTALAGRMKAVEAIEGLKKEKTLLTEVFPVLETPSLEEKPVAPKKARICAGALVLGVLVGCVLAIGKEKLM